jgi:hypothetical protein
MKEENIQKLLLSMVFLMEYMLNEMGCQFFLKLNTL